MWVYEKDDVTEGAGWYVYFLGEKNKGVYKRNDLRKPNKMNSRERESRKSPVQIEGGGVSFQHYEEHQDHIHAEIEREFVGPAEKAGVTEYSDGWHGRYFETRAEAEECVNYLNGGLSTAVAIEIRDASEAMVGMHENLSLIMTRSKISIFGPYIVGLVAIVTTICLYFFG